MQSSVSMDNSELAVCSQARWMKDNDLPEEATSDTSQKDMKFVNRNHSWEKYLKLKRLQGIDN